MQPFSHAESHIDLRNRSTICSLLTAENLFQTSELRIEAYCNTDPGELSETEHIGGTGRYFNRLAAMSVKYVHSHPLLFLDHGAQPDRRD